MFKELAGFLYTLGKDIIDTNNMDIQLIKAIESYDKDCVKQCLENGANPNYRKENGYTALMTAISFNWWNYNCFDILRILVENGADVNARANDGKTALMLAEKENIVRYLVSKGVDLNAKDNDGNTALMYFSNKQRYVVKTKPGIRDGRGIYNEEKLEIVKFLVANGAYVNAKNNECNTALMFAVKSKAGYFTDVGADLKVIKFLVASGADVNIRNNDGKTVLGMAQENETIEFLQNVGAKY